MLRALVVALLLANLGFYAWTQGWLEGPIGLRAQAEREPERLAHQVHPELVRVVTPQAVAAAASAGRGSSFHAIGIGGAIAAGDDLSTLLPSSPPDPITSAPCSCDRTITNPIPGCLLSVAISRGWAWSICSRARRSLPSGR